MIVIAHRARQHDIDLAPPRGVDKAVQEAVVGRLVRAQQELALRAATCDQVELTWKDLAWKHTYAAIKMLANESRRDLMQLAADDVRRPDSVRNPVATRRGADMAAITAVALTSYRLLPIRAN
ncbi:MAG TPA: hypothetical protein VLM79_23115, partial [Kofleriaceae bacterium]|nr:hypothetical protein [Kofleriaceae bacterium]